MNEAKAHTACETLNAFIEKAGERLAEFDAAVKALENVAASKIEVLELRPGDILALTLPKDAPFHRPFMDWLSKEAVRRGATLVILGEGTNFTVVSGEIQPVTPQ